MAVIAAAKAAGVDLIEISPSAVPPVAKIMDYGKFQYDEMEQANPTLVPYFYFPYIILFFFIVMNFFTAIIMNTYD
jgi:hypothetical protein